MGKKKMTLAICLIVISMTIRSQNTKSDDFEWLNLEKGDRFSWVAKSKIDKIMFPDICDIIDWGIYLNQSAPLVVKKLYVGGKKLIIFTVTGGSGIINYRIYVFKQEKQLWRLAAKSKCFVNQLPGPVRSRFCPQENKIVFCSIKEDNISLEKRNLGCNADITVLYDMTTELPPGTTPIVLGELDVDDI